MDILDNAPTAVLDFSVIPNGMISGLTGTEIDALMNEFEQPGEQETATRFSEPQSDKRIQSLKKNSVPVATLRRNQWSLNLFTDWQKQRREHFLPDESFTNELKLQLCEITTPVLDYWLGKFILEVRKRDGSRYPRDSLVSIVAGLNVNIKAQIGPVDIFKGARFAKTQEALDLAMKLSTTEGVGSVKKQAEVITSKDEEKLWSHTFGDSDPQKLQDTL